MKTKDIVVIGAGPAGVATALQLKRYGIVPTLLEGDEVGGLLRDAHLVENYPGFPKGIAGQDLVGLFREQLVAAGIEVAFHKVVQLNCGHEVFYVETNQGILMAAVVVIATGTKPKKIAFRLASDDLEDHIFYEFRPLRGITNKQIAIIGAGDAACDYALNLSRRNRVMILNRSRWPRCLPVLWERCQKSGNISYSSQLNVQRIERKGAGLLLYSTGLDNLEGEEIYADYLIVAIGREPRLDFLGGELRGNLQIWKDTNRLHLVGDVNNGRYRQTAICVGDGVRAAMQICETIAEATS